ncbi:beta-lactamase family protein [Pseudoxanthomonas winnipegensis]|uniref:serine hydrolase domain-containing protein n=1 Tax=Pseudoxanthomonas winnipegensis TaxID=2480810 RepID=UPI00257596A3|nr:serine hydrolase [Pseudoxanthomonas winnipegensis]WJI15535.1 beta-lactamase family protein [Pseudoxanthomonas winnipegensis]
MKRIPPLFALLAAASHLAHAASPPPLDDGWKVTDPVATGWHVEQLQAMERAIADGQAPDTTSLLIARDGALVYERYFGDSTRDTLQDTRSATKSVTALLVGAAIAQGALPGVQARVYDFFNDRRWQHPDPRKRAITVEDLLTMSSQWECDDDNAFSTGNEERMYLSADWVQFALDLPVKGYAPWMKRPAESPHGRAFAYCTAGAFLLGALVEKSTGQPLEHFAEQALERLLGIVGSHWNHASEGTGMGGGGTRYRSRDLAKLGQLLLDQGRWQGKQVLPSAWVEAMTTVHAQAREDADYGYLLWRFRFPVRGVERGVWAMSGNGGNYVFVLPEERLVAVITRRAYNQRQMHQQSQRLFADYVLKALP